MIKFFRTFYGKLTIVFLLLLLILGITQIYITMESASHFVSEVDQKLNLNLAKNMAFELKPMLKNDIDFNSIGERIHYMMVMNPKVEIYVLDDTGKILAFFAEPGKKVKADHVDLEPIYKFLKNPSNIPILGDDPRHPESKKPFSASQINLASKGEGYLYIVIGGEQYESVAAILRESYLVKAMLNGLIFSVMVAGIIGLILFALLTRRIRSMSEVVKQFEKGVYEKRINVKSNDEIGHLAQSFNQMAETIVANMEALRTKDDLRRELIANVSHDLRSPLSSIQGYLETIMIKEKNNTLNLEERNRYLEIILKNTKMLNKMIHELFELSKLEAKQIEQKVEPFSVAELTQDVVMKYRDYAEKLNIKIETVFQPDLPQVNADIAMIERALSNLIENAIDYTNENGVVRVELKQENDKIQTIIADSGCGISAKDLPYIFNRFYRGQKKEARKKTSTGLGLAIAKKLIEAHGSTIYVSSQENIGTTFSFYLAIHKAN
jgi:signal transduction histidine kinase